MEKSQKWLRHPWEIQKTILRYYISFGEHDSRFAKKYLDAQGIDY